MKTIYEHNFIFMKTDYLNKIEKLDTGEMAKIRGGAEKPRVEEDIIIINRKRRFF